jgi:DNA-binding NarL/FixJ family response regulator
VILLTNSASEIPQVEECRSLGIEAHLLKPVAQADLERAMRTALYGRGVDQGALKSAPVQPSSSVLS